MLKIVINLYRKFILIVKEIIKIGIGNLVLSLRRFIVKEI